MQSQHLIQRRNITVLFALLPPWLGSQQLTRGVSGSCNKMFRDVTYDGNDHDNDRSDLHNATRPNSSDLHGPCSAAHCLNSEPVSKRVRNFCTKYTTSSGMQLSPMFSLYLRVRHSHGQAQDGSKHTERISNQAANVIALREWDHGSRCRSVGCAEKACYDTAQALPRDGAAQHCRRRHWSPADLGCGIVVPQTLHHRCTGKVSLI